GPRGGFCIGRSLGGGLGPAGDSPLGARTSVDGPGRRDLLRRRAAVGARRRRRCRGARSGDAPRRRRGAGRSSAGRARREERQPLRDPRGHHRRNPGRGSRLPAREAGKRADRLGAHWHARAGGPARVGRTAGARRPRWPAVSTEASPGDVRAERLRGFGPLGLLAIVLILAGNLLFAPLSAILVLLWAWASRTPWREIGFVRPRSWIASILLGVVFGS